MMTTKRIHWLLAITGCVLVFLALGYWDLARPIVAYADTYDVSNTNDTGDGSLRQAIVDANANSGHDTITFSTSGTITLGSALPAITDDVTITGPSADNLAISGANLYQVLNITSSTTVTITGVTVRDGRLALSNGGGIYNAGTLVLETCVVSNNIVTGSWRGGGIYNEGTLTLENCTVSENTARQGGGIYNYSGTVHINDSTISGNTAENQGGGIFNYHNGMIYVNNSTISDNTAGGAFNDYGVLSILNSTVSGNTNGGILNNEGTVNILRSTISGNTGSGSTIVNTPSGALNIANSTISGNTGSVGGIETSGRVNISNCTISGNTGGVAGGIYGNSAEAHWVMVRNTIFSNNWPSGLANDCFGTGIYGSNNLVDDTSGPCSGEGFRIGAVTNFDTTLRDNGGPTFTHALLPGSNALDNVTDCTYMSSVGCSYLGCGTNPLFSDGAPITTDQRGYARPDPAGGSCDIGAYEYEVPVFVETVTLTPPSPVKAETVECEVTFSEQMNTSVAPTVTIGINSPYTDHTIAPTTGVSYTNGYLDSDTTKWYGTYTFTDTMGDGTYRISIAGAEDLAANQMVTDTSETFVLDTVPPSSSVTDLPTYQTILPFPVSWSGSDTASGIASYDVQVRSGVSWEDWQVNTIATSTAFAGEDGHTYYFQSRATDNAGNIESYPGSDGDTHTTVDVTPPSSSITNLSQIWASSSARMSALSSSTVQVAVEWEGNDDVSGVKWYDVQYKQGSAGTWTDWLTGTTQTSATFNATSGYTYYFQSRAEDNAGNWEDYPGGDGDAHLCVLYGDFDPNGRVDVADIMLVAAKWRMTADDPEWEARYDLDGDGIITVVDIMKVVVHWGESCAE